MVLLALLRLVPALRLALMLAYKPGRFDFILRLYHNFIALRNTFRAKGCNTDPCTADDSH